MADVLWSKGGEADLTSLDGDRIGLRSTIPSVPGSVLEGAFGEGARLRLKVARCRQREGAFAIDGRLLDVTRDLRARIAARLRSADLTPPAPLSLARPVDPMEPMDGGAEPEGGGRGGS